jgi:hypothetical protein
MTQTVKKIFDKGINTDFAEHLVPDGALINAENISFGPSIMTGEGYLQSVLGNSSLPNQQVKPAGTNTPIGGCIDEPRRRLIKFNHNSNGDHGIYCYDYPNSTEYIVLLNSQVTGGLGLVKNSLIHSAEVVGDLLFFTNNQGEPKVINIEAGIKLNHGGYTTSVVAYTSPLTQDDINLIKRPAIYPPEFEKKTDGGFSLNFIADSALKFIWRYYYRDYQYSVVSMWSKLSNFNGTSDTYNYVEVTMDTQETIPQTVQKIELIVYDAVTNVAKVVKTWDKAVTAEATEIANHNTGATPLTLNYYHNRGGVVLSASEMSTIEHAVPKKCLTLSYARKRLFLGNLTVGYNGPTQSSLTLTPVDGSSSPTLTNQTVYLLHVIYRNLSTLVLTYSSSYWLFLSSVPNPGWYYINGTEATNAGPTYPVLGSPPNPVDFVTDLTLVGDREIDAVHHLEPANNVMQSYTMAVTSGPDLITVNNAPTDNSGSFKANSPYQFGIAFWARDGRRRIGMYTDSSMIVNFADRDYTFSAYKRAVNWALSNTAATSQIPVDAYYYSIVRTQNLRTRNFLQSLDEAPRYAVKEPDGTYTVDLAAGPSSGKEYFAIDINNLKKDGLGYIFNEGDQITLYDSGGSIKVTLPIIAQTGSHLIIKFHDFGTLSGSSKFLYEIFIPYKPSDQEYFYEIGNMFPVTNPGGGTREFSTLNGTITGDVYLLGRTSLASTAYQAEAMSSNDKFWSQWYTDIGFAFPNVKGVEKEKPYSFRFSNTYILGTETNGNSAFDTLDEETLSLENGQIQRFIVADKVDDEGTVLLCICRSDTNSIYLGEAQISDATGAKVFFSKAEGVVGTINPLKGSRGTLNPESVCRSSNGLIFWYDMINGKACQYSQNGIRDVSDDGIARFSKLFSDRYGLVSSSVIEGYGSRPFVFGCVDSFNKEYLLAIPQVEETPPKGTLSDLDIPIDYPYDIYDGKAKVLAYKYDNNQWSAPYKYSPDWLISLGSTLFSYKGDNIYLHNDAEALPNSFYGIQSPSKIMFVVNEDPSAIKAFMVLQIESNIKPSYIHIRTEQPNIQSSDIIGTDAEWKKRRGVYKIKIFRDRLSPNVAGDANLKMKIGDKMRGNWAKVYLEFDPADGELRFRFINVTYKPSLGFSKIAFNS